MYKKQRFKNFARFFSGIFQSEEKSVFNSKVKISKNIYLDSRTIMSFLRITGIFPIIVIRIKQDLFLRFSFFYLFYSYFLWLLIRKCEITFINPKSKNEDLVVLAFYGQIEDIFIHNKNSVRVKFGTDKIVFFFSIIGYSFILFGGVFITTRKYLQFFKYIKRVNQVVY